MGANLLANRTVRNILKSRWYPGALQAFAAGVFVVIVMQLVAGPVSAHSNLGTALTWILWWPLIPILFVFLGRFWCTICPFGTLSDVVQKFVGNQRPVPKFLKKYGIWIIDVIFILITWSDHVFGIVENPWGSGVLLLLLTTGVVASGAFFTRRTWCRYLCFLGGLSGNYARSAMLSLRATPAVCATCTSKAACYNGNEKGPGCPMFEFPRTMDTNASCNLCAACVKTCPNDSITLTVQPPTKELWSVKKPRFEEAFLAVVIMGIVFVQNITMLEIWQPMLRRLEGLTGTTSYAVNFTIIFLIAMAIPVGLLTLAARGGKALNGHSTAHNFARFGYAIIPLDIAGHIAHNLFHLLAEGKNVLFTAQQFLGQPAQTGSPALAGIGTIQLLQYALLALGVVGSLYVAYRIANGHYGTARPLASFVPYAALVALLGVMNVILFLLPMAMRM
jgi:polyferredoxin